MIREFAKKVFSVDYRNSYCEAISRSLQQTAKCVRLVSIPVRVTIPEPSEPLQPFHDKWNVHFGGSLEYVS